MSTGVDSYMTDYYDTMIVMQKGEKMSEEQKKKISVTHKSFGSNHWTKRLEVRKKISKSNKGQTAWNKGLPAPWAKRENNHGWKGDDIGYPGVHTWLRDNFKKGGICKECGRTGLRGHKIHWANISKTHKRDIKDWVELCVSCHKKYDLGLIELTCLV